MKFKVGRKRDREFLSVSTSRDALQKSVVRLQDELATALRVSNSYASENAELRAQLAARERATFPNKRKIR